MSAEPLQSHLPREKRQLAFAYLDAANRSWLRAILRLRDDLLKDSANSSSDLRWERMADVASGVSLFAVALNSLLRTAELAEKVFSGRGVKEGITQFRVVVPNARDTRNILHYIEHYVLGLGRQQGPNDTHGDWEIVYEFEASTLLVRIGSAVRLDMAKATVAAEALSRCVTTAIATVAEEIKNRTDHPYAEENGEAS